MRWDNRQDWGQDRAESYRICQLQAWGRWVWLAADLLPSGANMNHAARPAQIWRHRRLGDGTGVLCLPAADAWGQAGGWLPDLLLLQRHVGGAQRVDDHIPALACLAVPAGCRASRFSAGVCCRQRIGPLQQLRWPKMRVCRQEPARAHAGHDRGHAARAQRLAGASGGADGADAGVPAGPRAVDAAQRAPGLASAARRLLLVDRHAQQLPQVPPPAGVRLWVAVRCGAMGSPGPICCCATACAGDLPVGGGEQVSAAAALSDGVQRQHLGVGAASHTQSRLGLMQTMCRQGLGQLLLQAGEQVAAAAGFPDAYVQACTKQRATPGPLGGNRLQPYTAATDMYRRAGCACLCPRQRWTHPCTGAGLAALHQHVRMCSPEVCCRAGLLGMVGQCGRPCSNRFLPTLHGHESRRMLSGSSLRLCHRPCRYEEWWSETQRYTQEHVVLLHKRLAD